MPAHHEQIGQRAGHEQAMRVLLQPAIAHLGKAEHPLDDPDRMFDPIRMPTVAIKKVAQNA